MGADIARSIRPWLSVVRRIIDEPIAGSAKVYLEDVVDLIHSVEGDLEQLTQMARNLEESQERFRDKRMNDILFALSIITAIFLPAQFWTGVYGMNFVAEDGAPAMPELTMEQGYVYFWIVAGISSCIMMVCLAIKSGSSWRCRLCLGCCCRRCTDGDRRVHATESSEWWGA